MFWGGGFYCPNVTLLAYLDAAVLWDVDRPRAQRTREVLLVFSLLHVAAQTVRAERVETREQLRFVELVRAQTAF